MASEALTVTIPRAMAGDVPTLSRELNDRMHELLERNTDALLSVTEQSELETLVKMAQFAQVLAMTVQEADSN